MNKRQGQHSRGKTESAGVIVYGSHWLCAGCADKLSKTQEMAETEDFKTGRCEMCMQFYSLSRYRSRPYPRAQYKRRTGGGERSRAGGDA